MTQNDAVFNEQQPNISRPVADSQRTVETGMCLNYDEARFLSTAINLFLRNGYYPEFYPNADVDYLIGKIQDAMEALG